MANLSSAFKLSWLAGLKDVSQSPKEGINAWLIANQASVSSWSADEFSISCLNPSPVIRAFAFECNEVIRSCFESALYKSSLPNGVRSHSWPVIQSYYGAFFAAIGLFRLTGKCLKRIDGTTMTAIARSARNNGIGGEGFGEGTYIVSYDAVSQSVIVRRLPGKGNESHRSLWRQFRGEISLVQEKLNNSTLPTPDKNQLFAKLQDLISNLDSGSFNGSWPSEMRISVNYRFEHDVWYPCKMEKRQEEVLLRAKEYWRHDPMSIPLGNTALSEIIRFVTTCQFIISVCHESTLLMADSCAKGKSFLQYGPLEMLRKANT